jgi:hypothetical protein
MKRFMAIGALLGFLIGTGVGLARHGDWPSLLWRSSASALAGALLLRWWGRLWIQCFESSLQARPRAEQSNPLLSKQ